jgi:hypothetical protein
VGAVAEGGLFGVLAAAPGDFLGGGDFYAEGGEGAAAMGAVAVGLLLAVAAGAPGFGARGLVDDDRAFAGDVGLVQGGLRERESRG